MEIRDVRAAWGNVWNLHKVLANALKLLYVSHVVHTTGKPTSSGLKLQVYDSIHAVPLEVWQSCNSRQNIFLSPNYLKAVEEAGPATLEFKYAIFFRGDEAVGIAYFQILELHPRLHRPAREAFAPRKPHPLNRLHDHLAGSFSQRLLVCGNALLSGEHGYAGRNIDAALLLHAVAEAAYVIGQNLSGGKVVTLIKDFYAQDAHSTHMLESCGYHRFDAGPNMVVPIRSHWTSLDAYLKDMKPKYRSRTQAALKRGAPLVTRELSLPDIQDARDVLFALYSEVVDRAKFRMFFLSPNYLEKLKLYLGDAFVCEAYYSGEEMVGFTTRIFNGDEMEGYAHGMRYACSRTYELYQNFMLADIRAAMAAGVRYVITGRTSIAMKSSVGAVPKDMKCYLRFSSPVANHLSRPLFHFIKPAREYYRNPFPVTGESDLGEG